MLFASMCVFVRAIVRACLPTCMCVCVTHDRINLPRSPAEWCSVCLGPRLQCHSAHHSWWHTHIRSLVMLSPISDWETHSLILLSPATDWHKYTNINFLRYELLLLTHTQVCSNEVASSPVIIDVSCVAAGTFVTCLDTSMYLVLRSSNYLYLLNDNGINTKKWTFWVCVDPCMYVKCISLCNHVWVCRYMCMVVHICIYLWVYACIYALYICMYVGTHKDVYLYSVHVCVRAWYWHMCVCLRARVCVFVHVFVHEHVRVRVHMCVCVCACECLTACVCVWACTCVYACVSLLCSPLSMLRGKDSRMSVGLLVGL